MLLKKFFVTITFIHFIFYGFSSIQFYEGFLNQGEVTAITPNSFISWGAINIDFIKLERIAGADDGMIRFSIQPTDYVEVSLTKADNLDARFGFIFKSFNHFTIQLNGVEEDLGNLGYNETDVFRVVKCGPLLRFYKNMDLLYEHCDTDSAEDLVHTTHVTTAVNTELSLVFDSELSDCSDPFMLAPPEDQMMVLENNSSESSPEPNEESISNQSLNALDPNEQMTFAKNKTIVASVFSQEGFPVKQFRIRITKSGKLPESHVIYDYIKENYKVEFKKIKINTSA